jgi:hypothetical protein
VVTEEIVYLKEYEGKITNTFREPEEQVWRPDPALTAQFLQFFRETTEAAAAIGVPLTVEELFKRVVARYGEEACGSLFKTPLDLSTLLHIYSHIFHIQANVVTLVPQRSFPSVTTTVLSHNNNKVQFEFLKKSILNIFATFFYYKFTVKLSIRLS